MTPKIGGKMSENRINVWWDDKSEPEKWHVDVLREVREGHYECTFGSESPDFPVDVDDFGPLEEDSLIQTLKGAFPEAEIRLLF
jgi:hypothetical protein